MKTEPQRTCPSCGNEFSGVMEFCPVCMLRKGLASGVSSGESSFEEAVEPTPDQPPKRFEHYELVTAEDVLLEKDPRHRFQNPAELLKAIPTITGALDARRKITRQSL